MIGTKRPFLFYNPVIRVPVNVSNNSYSLLLCGKHCPSYEPLLFFHPYYKEACKTIESHCRDKQTEARRGWTLANPRLVSNLHIQELESRQAQELLSSATLPGSWEQKVLASHCWHRAGTDTAGCMHTSLSPQRWLPRLPSGLQAASALLTSTQEGEIYSLCRRCS